MIRILPLIAIVLLAACGKDPDDSIEPVPTPTAESANRLMGEAERAAGNAQERMPPPSQGERK